MHRSQYKDHDGSLTKEFLGEVFKDLPPEALIGALFSGSSESVRARESVLCSMIREGLLPKSVFSTIILPHLRNMKGLFFFEQCTRALVDSPTPWWDCIAHLVLSMSSETVNLLLAHKDVPAELLDIITKEAIGNWHWYAELLLALLDHPIPSAVIEKLGKIHTENAWHHEAECRKLISHKSASVKMLLLMADTHEGPMQRLCVGRLKREYGHSMDEVQRAMRNLQAARELDGSVRLRR